jgi:aldehyde dehydrogenase (NAD+)
MIGLVNPTSEKAIARAVLGNEEDTRHAIAAARRAFADFSGSTKDERASLLRRLHQAAMAHLDDLTAMMVEELGGVVQCARLIVETGINAFIAAEQALLAMPLKQSWGKTTVTLEPIGVAGLITTWNANTLLICSKPASAVAAGCTVVCQTERAELVADATRCTMPTCRRAS